MAPVEVSVGAATSATSHGASGGVGDCSMGCGSWVDDASYGASYGA